MNEEWWSYNLRWNSDTQVRKKREKKQKGVAFDIESEFEGWRGKRKNNASMRAKINKIKRKRMKKTKTKTGQNNVRSPTARRVHSRQLFQDLGPTLRPRGESWRLPSPYHPPKLLYHFCPPESVAREISNFLIFPQFSNLIRIPLEPTYGRKFYLLRSLSITFTSRRVCNSDKEGCHPLSFHPLFP